MASHKCTGQYPVYIKENVQESIEFFNSFIVCWQPRVGCAFMSRLLLYRIPSEVCGDIKPKKQVVMPTQGDNRPVAPRFAAVQQLCFTA